MHLRMNLVSLTLLNVLLTYLTTEPMTYRTSSARAILGDIYDVEKMRECGDVKFMSLTHLKGCASLLSPTAEMSYVLLQLQASSFKAYRHISSRGRIPELR